jgi:hypothetical protein
MSYLLTETPVYFSRISPKKKTKETRKKCKKTQKKKCNLLSLTIDVDSIDNDSTG